jgi:hypothetical protein
MDPDGDVAPRVRGHRATKDIGMGHSLVTKLYFVKWL